jgi:hypothetical protein
VGPGSSLDRVRESRVLAEWVERMGRTVRVGRRADRGKKLRRVRKKTDLV